MLKMKKFLSTGHFLLHTGCLSLNTIPRTGQERHACIYAHEPGLDVPQRRSSRRNVRGSDATTFLHSSHGTSAPAASAPFSRKCKRTVPFDASASCKPSLSLPAACAPFYQVVKRRQFRLHKIAAFLFHNLIVSLTEVSFFQENLPHSFPLLRLPVRL